MTQKQKHNFVGHILYPYTQAAKEFFFYSTIKKTVRSVFFGDVLIEKFNTKITQQAKMSEMLIELGYTIKDEILEDKGSHVTKTLVAIPCNNDDCRHFCERVNGMCRTPISAKVDRVFKNKKVVEQNIVVSYAARDIQEVSNKSECMLWYIKETLGLQGEADVYGKAELC